MSLCFGICNLEIVGCRYAYFAGDVDDKSRLVDMCYCVVEQLSIDCVRNKIALQTLQ